MRHSGVLAPRRRASLRVALAAACLGATAAAVPGYTASAVPAHTHHPALSARSLLSRLVDPVAALRPLPPALQVLESSSHDRRGANGDDATFDPATSHTGTGSYIREEPGGFVIFDRRGPGCVTRMFLAGVSGTTVGGVANFGHLQFLFDGARTPRLDIAAADLVSGTAPGFPTPLVGDAAVSSGGAYSYVPICFAHRLVIRAADTDVGLHFFSVDAVLAPVGTPVEEYDAADVTSATTWAAARLRDVGLPPSGRPASSYAGSIDPDHAAVHRIRGAGTLRYLRIGVRPFTHDVLTHTHLQLTVDGARRPQVKVPLADVFGDGTAVHLVRSMAFGMDPSQHAGYFALPAPYDHGATIRLTTTTHARVDLRAWTGAPMSTRTRLVAHHAQEKTRIGEDYTVLRARGSGRIAAWVLDYVGQQGTTTAPSGQTYLEGDPRIYVDGLRSPVIYGTGTEDTFNAGFYFVNGAFTLPTHGAGPVVSTGIRTRQSAYRVFGLDSPLWSRRLRFNMEHGAGDESTPTVINTVFSYQAPRSVVRTDAIDPGSAASLRAHAATGERNPVTLAAYFEGTDDGNLVLPIPLLAGEGAAPPADESPEGVTARGIRYRSPLSFTVAVRPHNHGVLLRRLTDAGAPYDVRVSVDGHAAGTWVLTETNTFKRWREDEFALPARLTAGHRTLRIRLAPAGGADPTLYAFSVWSVR